MRLDQYLVKNGFVETRSKATDLIKRQLVMVNETLAKKPGQEINEDMVKVLDTTMYVGRGGEKLAGAIKAFHLDIKDKVVIDVGSSTGGFTDVCLKEGASHVYAYDVGFEQMVPSLKDDPRVSLYEQTNFLDVKIPKADIIVIDVSFISITSILEHIKDFKGLIIGLIKPQFEIGPTHMKHGVLKDLKAHKKILISITDRCKTLGFKVNHIMPSTLKGKKGNQEYIIVMNAHHQSSDDIIRKIEEITC